MEEQGKVCKKCGVWKSLEEYNKQRTGKCGRRSVCRECQKEYQKQWDENNKEHRKEYHKQHYQNNKEHYKQYRENNKERRKEYHKQYAENNKEHRKEYCKQWYQNNKQNNLQYISSMLDQTNPFFKQLNLPVYGYIYKFKNIKTGHVYIGQTTHPLKERYKGGVVKSWIKDRLKKQKQNFKDELIEEDIEVTEVLDVACCQYHLNILEVNYITKYDSYNNGYNNNAGYYKDDTGKEEFEQILKENGLQFIDGKLVKIA